MPKPLNLLRPMAALLLAGLVIGGARAEKKPQPGRAVSPDGKVVALAAGNDIQILDAATQKALRVVKGHQAAVTALAFSPDGKLLASGSQDKSVALWDVASGKQLLSIRGAAGITGVTFAPDGKTLTAQTADQKALTWDVATGKRLK